MAGKKRFSFIDVLKWICVDSDLGLHDHHAKLKVRMRAHGCRPLSTKTIDSLFQVFSVFDNDGSGELDRDEIGRLFTLMTTSAATVKNDRSQDDSPMSPVALARKARRHSMVFSDRSGGVLSGPLSGSSSPFLEEKSQENSPSRQQYGNNTNNDLNRSVSDSNNNKQLHQDPLHSLNVSQHYSKNINDEDDVPQPSSFRIYEEGNTSNNKTNQRDASVLSNLSPLISPDSPNANNNANNPRTSTSMNHQNEAAAGNAASDGTRSDTRGTSAQTYNNNHSFGLNPLQLPTSQMINEVNEATNMALSEDDLDILMEVIDEDGSGTINFEEALLLLASDLDRGFFGKHKFAKKLLADTIKIGAEGFFDDSSSSSSSDSDDDLSSSGDDDEDEDDDPNDENKDFVLNSGSGRGNSKNKNKKKKKKSLSSSSASPRGSGKNSTLSGIRESGLDHKIMHAFRKFDPYRTGYISLLHLRQAVLELAGEHLTLAQIEDIIGAADGIRGDGYVHYLSWDSLWQCARGESSLKDS